MPTTSSPRLIVASDRSQDGNDESSNGVSLVDTLYRRQGANVPAWMETEMALNKTVVEPSWEAKYSYSPAIIAEGGKTVWLAGHVGFVDDSGASLAGNFDAQTRQAFKNIDKTLHRAGGTLKDIVWMTVSVSDGRYSQRFTDIRKEIYGDQFPASTLLTAAAFAVPEIMVEITAIAVIPA
jgi:2-iminobutanoate/2-iminopropanoate deaminase